MNKLKDLLNSFMDFLKLSLHTVLHAMGWVEGHSHSFWEDEVIDNKRYSVGYAGTMCSCGKIHNVRRTNQFIRRYHDKARQHLP